MNKFYDTGLSKYAVPGALTAYDLPDLIGCMAPRKVALVGGEDQMKKTASRELIDEALSFPRAAYTLKNSTSKLHTVSSAEDISSIERWCFE